MRKQKVNPQSYFNDLVADGISSLISGTSNQIGIVEFAEEIIFNGEEALYPSQKAVLKAFYGEELTDDEKIILYGWKDDTISRTTWVEGRRYKNLVMEIGRRGTKSTMISIIVLYEFFKLITLEKPASEYGLILNSPIHIFVIANSLDQVKQTLFAAIIGYAKGSDYFKSLENSKVIEILTEEIRCPGKNIHVHAKHAGNTKSLVGYSLKLLVIDEAARFENDEFGVSKADIIWENVGAGCLHKDSFLLTKEGYKQAGELFDNFDKDNPPIIISYNELDNFKKVHTPIELWDNGIKETRTITTFSGREEIFTYNHPVYIWKSGEIEPCWEFTQNLKERDLIACTRKLDIFSETSKLSTNRARLLGYLWGDGALSNGVVKFINITPGIVDDFKNILSVEFPDCYLRKTNKEVEYKYIVTSGEARTNSCVKWMRENNLLGDKAPVKRIPSLISSSTKQEIAAFLNGLFATDGYVSKGPCGHIGIHLTSKGLIEDIQRELIRLGIYSTIRPKLTKARLFRGRYLKDSHGFTLEIRTKSSIEIFYKEIGITAKNHKLEALFNSFVTNSTKTTSPFNLMPIEFNYRIKAKQKESNLEWKDLGIDYHWKRNKLNLTNATKAASILNDTQGQSYIDNFYWEPIVKIQENESSPTIGVTVQATSTIGNPIFSHNTKTFGEEGLKIAISSAWEPKDYIERLYELAEKDPKTLGCRLRTWDVNLNPTLSEAALKSSDDYIKNPIKAALEFEGIRTHKQGTFFTEANVKSAFIGYSACDAHQIPLDVTNKEGDTRTYTGIQITRLTKSLTQSFAHVDYGVKKDGAAFAVCSPIQIEERKWGISVDVLMLWKPYVDRDKDNKGIKRIVSFVNTEEIFYEVAKARRVMKFSFDAYQSEAAIQRLHLDGINTCLMSTATAEQSKYYTTTRKLIDHGLLILPKDSHWSISAELELSNIIELPNGKITHSVYAKDLSDAITNSVYNCYLYMVQNGTIIQNAAFTASVAKVANSSYHNNSNLRSKLPSSKSNLLKLKRY